VANGSFIEYDAQTDRGNSGGPLFDIDTGLVYGLVTWVSTGTTGALQNNLAIAMLQTLAFLSHANVAPRLGAAGIRRSSMEAKLINNTWSRATKAPTPSPTPAFDQTSCQNGIADLRSAYEDWRTAYNRYLKAADDTGAAMPSYAASGLAYAAAAIYAAYELKAINSVIDAEEPKLTSAETIVESSRAFNTARITSDIVSSVHQLDAYSLLWTESRYRALIALESGNAPGPIDLSARERARNLLAQIDADLTQMRLSNLCTS
jgi:hypothetical protein